LIQIANYYNPQKNSTTDNMENRQTSDVLFIGGYAIKAGVVRVEGQKFYEIANIVPETTLEYLKKIDERKNI
jgi:citrate lyase synthetase